MNHNLSYTGILRWLDMPWLEECEVYSGSVDIDSMHVRELGEAVGGLRGFLLPYLSRRLTSNPTDGSAGPSRGLVPSPILLIG